MVINNSKQHIALSKRITIVLFAVFVLATSLCLMACKASEDTDYAFSCTLMIECRTIYDNLDKLDRSKFEILPEDGVILGKCEVGFNEGDSVYDVLQRELRKRGIHMEANYTPIYDSAYIEGISNFYEFDCGELSGWTYCVNGIFPNVGCSSWNLSEGDEIEWHYTCDLGRDVGADISGVE